MSLTSPAGLQIVAVILFTGAGSEYPGGRSAPTVAGMQGRKKNNYSSGICPGGRADIYMSIDKRTGRTALTDVRGFTLIELMVVMVILGILASLIVPRIMDRPEEARRTKAMVDIQALEQALQLYKLDNGQYPTTEQGLQALIEAPSVGRLARKWRKGGYLDKNRVPVDPWGNEFIYISPGLHGDFDLMSYGPDGEPGGEGADADINNWEL